MMQIKKQLIKIREVVTRVDDIEQEIGDILNTYRIHVLDTLEDDEKIIMESLIRPLEVQEGSIKKNLALILCDQLLEIL